MSGESERDWGEGKGSGEGWQGRERKAGQNGKETRELCLFVCLLVA